ncbi:hypothetical protein J4727_18035 [Providencia rettgeri]|uniref:Uncharacterized protein n=1 Tax=Providencia rettgeri TaxID=587 RepID=A0A939NBE7_PRORE|nr:hypothetical protein [Providencia rettgeri]
MAGRQFFDIEDSFAIEARLDALLQQAFYCLHKLHKDEQQQEHHFQHYLLAVN